ncbi:PspA/IM30 family protein [Natronorarus salvus]|uniref:PspA/IM30 family protein n=1 Tax=Natronorarus salvus TaxID=3117733 RepID=UPI002F2651BA
MGVLDRTTAMIESTLDGLVDSASDADEELDYAHEQMREELRAVDEGLVNLVSERNRLERRSEELDAEVERRNDQAREAVSMDREDVAREALEAKERALREREEVDRSVSELKDAEAELREKKAELAERVERFGTEKEILKADRMRASLEAGTTESAEGIARAEEALEERSARAAATEELRESGALTGPLDDEDEIGASIERERVSREIEDELDTIRAEVGEESEEPDGSDDEGSGSN